MDPTHLASRPVSEWEKHWMAPWRPVSTDRLRRELDEPKIGEMPGTSHMSIGFADPDEA